MYGLLRSLMPGPLRRWVMHFESVIEAETARFAASLPDAARVLDAGAGELQYAPLFARHRYLAVDLGIGDANWNYRKLHCIADLEHLPLPAGVMDAAINIVTLEHVREPRAVVAELARVLRPGGRLFLVVPHQWEVHQAPHDYYRYTSHGIRYLLDSSGFIDARISPVGGYFRMMSRRLLNGLQFFPPLLVPLVALLVAPVALILPVFDSLDRRHDFTLGYVCTAIRS